jgi:pimeloyl-ACP methyl ester carboxylesterase
MGVRHCIRRDGASLATLRGAPGFLVGTVLKIVTRPEPTLEADPRWQSRLAELESRYRYLADACPNLCEVERAVHDQAMVFVHGTLSCGMVSLKDLFGLAVEGYSVAGPVYRYEHDTFLPLKANADELADWIEHKLRIGRRLVIAAHSRGGLVAVAAAARLMKNRYPAEIVVRTFGTPFRGTPLVAIGKKALTVLAKLGEDIATAVPVPMLSALAKGFFYLFDSPTLPPGIMAMQEGRACSTTCRTPPTMSRWRAGAATTTSTAAIPVSARRWKACCSALCAGRRTTWWFPWPRRSTAARPSCRCSGAPTCTTSASRRSSGPSRRWSRRSPRLQPRQPPRPLRARRRAGPGDRTRRRAGNRGGHHSGLRAARGPRAGAAHRGLCAASEEEFQVGAIGRPTAARRAKAGVGGPGTAIGSERSRSPRARRATASCTLSTS